MHTPSVKPMLVDIKFLHSSTPKRRIRAGCHCNMPDHHGHASRRAVCPFLAHANSVVAAMFCPYRLRGSSGVKLEMNVSHKLPDCLKFTTALTTLLAVSGCLCQVITCHACTTFSHSSISQSKEHMFFLRCRYVQSRIAPWIGS